MIQAAVLSVPAISQVTLSFPVIAVSLTVPVIELQYTIPTAAWLLDVRGLHAQYTDGVQLSDAQTYLFEKVQSDQVSFADNPLYDLTLGKADTVAFLDQFDRVCSFFRDFPETVGISDTQAISLDKPLTDGIKISDQFSAQIGKVFSDGVSISDAQFTKSISPVYGDIVRISDSFYLNGNNYCEFSYFAEDYVGAVRQI